LKKSRLLGAVCAYVLFLITTTTNASVLPLEGRLPVTPGGTDYQAYYDPNLSITWAADANINGLMDWDAANAWVASLTISGVSGWRLPSADVNGANGIADCLSGLGDVCSDNEMAYLFHKEGINASSPGPFNIPFNPNGNAFHWSGTEYDSDEAWDLSFVNGDQSIARKSADDYAWAVHWGDVGTAIVIDIKPSKKPDNVIDLKKDKNLKVAIVGSDTFDALQVDPMTVRFGPNASPVRFKGQDYNRDGFSDLILTFKLSDTDIDCFVNSATLTGQTSTDPVINIVGSDSFTVEPCSP